MSTTMNLEEIEKQCDNIYEAVIVASKRARQIHDKMNQELKKQIGEVENEEDLDEEIVDRERIVKEFDKKNKPSTTAVNELMEGKLHIVQENEEE